MLFQSASLDVYPTGNTPSPGSSNPSSRRRGTSSPLSKSSSSSLLALALTCRHKDAKPCLLMFVISFSLASPSGQSTRSRSQAHSVSKALPADYWTLLNDSTNNSNAVIIRLFSCAREHLITKRQGEHFRFAFVWITQERFVLRNNSSRGQSTKFAPRTMRSSIGALILFNSSLSSGNCTSSLSSPPRKGHH